MINTDTLFGRATAFSSFAVDDLPKAKQFYGETLGLGMAEENGLMMLQLGGGHDAVVYPKPDHKPGNYTILNFKVDDIDRAVDSLIARGIRCERYDGMEQDAKGISRRAGGPYIAWFEDPAGNILSVLQVPR